MTTIGHHNDVHWSHNDVRASIKLFSLNLCLIWLWIFKGCFVDLGNWFKLNNKNKLEAKLDNHIRLLCTNKVNFHDLCLDFYSQCTPPL